MVWPPSVVSDWSGSRPKQPERLKDEEFGLTFVYRNHTSHKINDTTYLPIIIHTHPGNKSRSQSAQMSGRWITKYGVTSLIN